MAEDVDKTEQPTQRRRQEARKKGQVAKSADLNAAVLILVGLLTLDLFGRSMLERLYLMTLALLGGVAPVVDQSQMVVLGRQAATEMLGIMVPLLIIFALSALVVALLQTGWLVTGEMLKPDLNKMNPISGLKKIFSSQTVATMLINVVKLGVVGAVAFHTLYVDLNRILYVSGLAFTEMVKVGIDLFFTLALRIAVVLIILGIIDYFWQRHEHEKQLRMTKQEVKEEMRSMEGDPVMKRRRREVQMQLAIQRMRKDVPRADVVVTNPTQLAVALKYEPHSMSAPRVLAKGQGYMAQRIRQIALTAGVPIVEKKPLAQALYKLVEVGQEIPAHLYKAVAEVLAYVYELSGKRSGIRTEVEQAAV